MPTFGEYETVGDPVAITDEGGHVSTVWQARKNGAGDRLCAIKCFSPHPKSPRPDEDSADAPLETELRLEFIETVKHLKKARTEGARNLAPIHEFGISDEGAWYAADYYKRTLKTWISLRGVVDDGALRHVISCITAGCLAMKKSCGRSHGNVKVGNIFLAGKPQAFRKTPLELIDARPASMVHAFRRGSDSAGRIAELTEIHDLHAIGLIILQLIEGRIVRNEHDYNYPIQDSPYWRKLGKDADHWRNLCNQLLDPNLTLQDVTLESLAKKYRPSAAMGKTPLMIGGGVAALCVIGVIIYLLVPNADKKFQAHLVAAQDAYDATNLLVARREINLATKYKPQDPAGTDLKAKIEQRFLDEFRREMTGAQQEFRARHWDEAAAAAKRATTLDPSSMEPGQLLNNIQQTQAYQTAIEATADALKREDYPSAIQHANEALKAKPDDVSAKNLLAQASDGRKLGEFEDVLKKAQAAYEQRDYATVLTQADAALAMRPSDAKAISLKRDAQAQLKQLAAQTEGERNYQQAMSAARAASAQNDYAAVVAQADKALAIRPNDPAAAKLKSDAQSHQREQASQAENDRRYQQAISLAQTAYDQRDFQGAITQANNALAFRPNDSAAGKLKSDAQARQRETAAQAERDRSYREAMDAARTALNARNYAEAATHADTALTARPNDADATQLKNDAVAREREAAAQAEIDRKYRDALIAAQASFATQDYATTVTQADAALALKPNDSAATRLKSDAQSRQRAAALQAENDQKYQQALSAAQSAFAKQDYATTISQADAALAVRPNDSTAAGLKSDAQTKQRELAVQADNARKYKDAITGAQQALRQKDYATALAQADAALQIKSGDADATNLKTQAINARDLQQAQAYFQQGNYDSAQQLCNAHKGTPDFDALSQSIAGKYTDAITAARQALAQKDYASTVSKADAALAIRPNDTAASQLKNDAQAQVDLARKYTDAIAAARQALARNDYATAIAQADAALQMRAGDADATTIKNQAAGVVQQLQTLDGEFETYLVRFNVISSSKALSASARKESAIVADMPEELKNQYRGRVTYLEGQYKQGGWLDKPGGWDKKKSRQEFLSKLKDHIENHS